METDLAAETARQDLRVVHIGYSAGELRMILVASIPDQPSLALRLLDVHSFFDQGLIGAGPVIASVADPGSFSWQMSQEERLRYREVRFNLKSDTMRNVFRVLAHKLILKYATAIDKNFPG